jgi:hypothetical protein
MTKKNAQGGKGVTPREPRGRGGRASRGNGRQSSEQGDYYYFFV